MERFRDTAYLVTRDGRVWSEKSNRFLSGMNRGGYRRVDLAGVGRFVIHRMVAELYIPNPHNKPEVNHINAIKDDNRVENLEWCTGKENREHATEMGLLPRGEDIPTAKLTKEDVFKIYKLKDNGVKQMDIAKQFNVKENTLSDVVNNKTWSHLYEEYYGFK